MKYKNQVFDSVLDLVGSTPLIKLNKITSQLHGDFYAKVEAFNPGHSSKDRVALYIVEQAEKQGFLKPGDTIIEAISGNTGFSIAMVSMIKGYNCILAVSSKASVNKIDMLRTMGAKVYVCPENVSADHPKSYYKVAKRLHKEIEESVYINQYINQLNIDTHYKSTGPEIWKQTAGKITHLVACSSMEGIISGTAKYLKEQNPNIQILGVDTFCSGLKTQHDTKVFNEREIYSYRIEALDEKLIPTATEFDVVDEVVKVSHSESAHTARYLAKTEGMFVGYTFGAVMQAVFQLGAENRFSEKDVVVVIFPDHGSRYMSKIYSNKWMNEQGFFDHFNKETVQNIEFIR
ncbi:PLP-dependent cysteine synthase family protein [Formosa sp. L2A11]|uniref:PLP-dependent cysteine synthase family protein n=1 Tax=Formosa sp. L2A11 TaxID=2686363 RepID=UPI00131B1300|nr:pyridoxal-phosphate dependent enzyme [Formosa sp. L2A11]